MTSKFDKPLGELESKLGLPSGFTEASPDAQEPHAASAITWLQNSRPSKQNFWPALCLAFIAQAESLLAKLGVDRQQSVFATVERKKTSAAKAVDQLVWIAGETDVPVRRFYNSAADVIIHQMRREHPSAPGHATSKWEMYSDFITHVAATSPQGRLAIAEWIWQEGVLSKPITVSTANRRRRPRPFFEIIKSLDMVSGTTGGAVFQGIVYAYLYADSPTLTVVSQRVNTASRRAGVIGDVSGFLGEHVVLAVEAKDKDLSSADEADLVTFLEESSEFPDLDAVVFARSFDDHISSVLGSQSVRTMSIDDMLRVVQLWDIPKQENAIRALRFFLGQIQKNQQLVARVEDFLTKINADKTDGS